MDVKKIESIYETSYEVFNDNSSTFNDEMCGDCDKCKNICPTGIRMMSVRDYVIIGGAHQ